MRVDVFIPIMGVNELYERKINTLLLVKTGHVI